MDISDAVRTLTVESKHYTGPFPPNVHVVSDGGEAVFIDSGFPEEEALAVRLGYLHERPDLRLTHIILTHHHVDHSSGAATYRTSTGARIAMHAEEVELLLNPRPDAPQDIDPGDKADAERRARYQEWLAEAKKATPDVRLADGDEIAVGGKRLVAVHTPGHTRGHLCLYLPDERLMFTGDCVLGVGTTAVSPPPYGDMGAYIASLRKLQGFEIERLIPGHGPPVADPQRKLAELIQHRLDREEQVLANLRKGRHTVPELIRAIYPELDKRLMSFARSQMEAHLAKLEADGRAAREGEGEAARYTPL